MPNHPTAAHPTLTTLAALEISATPEDTEPVETVLELLEHVVGRRDMALVLAKIWELSPLQQDCVRDAYVARLQELEAGYEL